MNFETPSSSASRTESRATASTASGRETWADDAPQPRNRTWLIVAAIALLALVLVGAYYAFSGNKGDAAANGTAPAAEGEEGERAAPSVTVMVPGRTTVSHVISATGTLAARREMPVGVAGEGGQIVRVLVEPGQWVGAGQVLATVDRSVQSQQIEQLSAQIRVSEADARLAQAELNRAQALSGRGFISAADLDRKTATRDSAAARVRVSRAQLAEARARTGRLDIRAPAAGLVLTRGVEPGQIVSPGSGVLFRIARGGEMELLASVGEADLAMLSAGARATVTPVGTSNSVSGQIWQLAPVIDPQTRQGVARIALPYSAGIRPGGFAEARIIAGAAQAPLLPESAVQHDETSSYVYIINAERKAVRRNITAGAVSDSGVPVVAGLTGTEQVVVSAGAFLNDGDAVTPVIQRR